MMETMSAIDMAVPWYGFRKGLTCGTEPSIPHHNVKSTFSNQCKARKEGITRIIFLLHRSYVCPDI